MSQPKITLRPPPNVDFVQGYPGIPPGAPDRPQAAVKGAIEVRVGPAGVKAKWVRIELRKVETLPGGGVANTYFDFVGQSPINLWQASEEYAVLETQDFPFYIRIPESIPPSIALEKGAGIKYELIATLCIKGKKGFLRRDKHIIVSSSSPIVIDKHELHSTWPVYQQPDTRNISMEGVTLSVFRTNTCYGPGDRIAVMATVKSDNLNTVILRGFEFLLRESTVFRAGANSSSKKGQPMVKTGNISEQRVPVNATLYGGMQHKAELAVTVPSHHTSTTLNTARHIDITYVLTVKALLGTSKPVSMDLPVIISNWPRSVSVEAVRRIGLAPSVSSHTNVQPANVQPNVAGAIGRPIVESSINKAANNPYMNPPPATAQTDTSSEVQFNTAPSVAGTSFAKNVDEFGARARGQSIDQRTNPQIQTIGGSQTGAWDSANTGVRPRSSGGRTGAPAANRLTVTNFHDDMPEEVRNAQLAARAHTRNTSLGGGRPGGAGSGPRTGFMTAEEEKKILYERAKAKVEEVQGVRSTSPPLEVHSPKPIRDNGPIQLNGADTGSGSGSRGQSRSAWPTAEEEKARLFNSAQDAVRKAQGLERGASPAHARNGSLSGQPSVSAGAALYSQAMASVQRNASAGQSSSASPAPALASPAPSRRYPTVEEEKAALNRYYEAKAAVDRNQNAAFGPIPEQTPPPATSPHVPNSNPIPYDALYPSTPPRQGGLSPPPVPRDSPPAFSSSSQAPAQPSYLSEKEKLRRAYEERDAAALAAQQQAVSPAISAVHAPAYYGPPPSTPPQQNFPNSASAEKERLRRQYEAQDAGAVATSPPPQPPPRSATGGRGLPVPRAQPTPPAGGSSSRPLTAAEEKARLKAMYAAEERGQAPPAPYSPPATNGVNGNGVYTNGNGHADLHRQLSASTQASHYADVPPPPPLMPRPPKEYYDETRLEDQHLAVKIQAIDQEEENGFSAVLDRPTPSTTPSPPERQVSPPLGSAMPLVVPPPPPLPPKVGIIDP